MKKVLDIYFNKPVLIDYLVGILIATSIFLLDNKYKILGEIDNNNLVNFSSDIASVGLTVAGFILTLLTILITFKSTEDQRLKELSNSSSSFEIFFGSPLYFKAVKILQNAVGSLAVVSIVLFLVKLFLHSNWQNLLLYLNLLGVLVILTSFFRSLFILHSLVKLQNKGLKNEN